MSVDLSFTPIQQLSGLHLRLGLLLALAYALELPDSIASSLNGTDSTLKENSVQVLPNCNNSRESTHPPMEIHWVYSTVDLMYLAQWELTAMSRLTANSPAELFEREAEGVTRWRRDYEESTVKGTAHLTKDDRRDLTIASHPLMIFRMIRRFVNGASDILEHAPGTVLAKAIQTLQAEVMPPSSADLEHIMDSILRIMNTYDLSADSLIAGEFPGRSTHAGLTQRQTFEIGVRAYKLNMFSQANGMLNAAYNMTESNEFETIDKESIRRHLNLVEDAEYRKPSEPVHNHKQRYEYLCKGHNFQPKNVKSDLRCWYETRTDLAWAISPLKMELHDRRIGLFQIHEALGVKMVQFIAEEAAHYLEPAVVVPSSSGPVVSHLDRTSSVGFLPSSAYSVLDVLDRKIGRMVGLVVLNPLDQAAFKASENLQVAASAVGGHYLPHMDLLPDDHIYPKMYGNRLATFMIYLSNVELGGRTVFTTLGTSILPEKGSAVFWYNKKRNGEPSISEHAGCPVILGQKWVANKWIHGNANFQRRKCSLQPNE